MGVILKQSRINSIIIASSFLLGAVYTVFIIPKLFDEHPEQWGLIQLLIYYAQIIAIFVLFSQPSVIIKFFPEYYNKGTANTLVAFSLIITICLFCIFGIAWYFFGISFYFETNRALYEKYYLILIPILLGSVVFEVLGAYSRIRQRSVMPFFLNTSLQKAVFFVALVVMLFTGLSFDTLILLLIATFLLKPIILFIDLVMAKMRLNLVKLSLRSLDLRKIFDYSIFGIFSGIAYLLIMRVDSLMIGNMLGLDQLAYYSIPVFLVTAMSIPEKSIAQISLPVVSSLYANSDFKGIETIYKKVSVNQFLLGGIIFLLIWINIDGLMEILGEKFGNTTWAFFFLGIGKLFDLFTSANGQILSISEKYRYNLVLQILLMVLAVVLNYLLIPVLGINGAALATAISIILYNLIKTWLVYRWYKVHPFSSGLIWVFLFLIATGFLFSAYSLPNMYWSIVVKCLLFMAFSLVFILFGRASDDIKEETNRLIRKHLFIFKG